jgi:hypothetical protein
VAAVDDDMLRHTERQRELRPCAADRPSPAVGRIRSSSADRTDNRCGRIAAAVRGHERDRPFAVCRRALPASTNG